MSQYTDEPPPTQLFTQQVSNVTVVVFASLFCLGFTVIGLMGLFMPVMAKVLVVYSNAAFVMPAVKAFELNRETMAPSYVVMMFFSSFYHTCNNWSGLCVLPANLLRKMDFFMAQYLIMLTALYIIQFTRTWAWVERWLIVATLVALFVVEATLNEPFAAQIIIAGVAALFIIIYWVVYAVTRKNGSRFPPYDWEAFSMGIALLALACVLFSTQRQWHLGYPWVHSVWHVLAALGQYYILCTRRAAPRDAAMDAVIKKNVF